MLDELETDVNEDKSLSAATPVTPKEETTKAGGANVLGVPTYSPTAESYAKIMTADFVISLSRKIEDKIAGTGRWHVIKNRFGPDGVTLPSKMNASNGQIDIFEASSVQGQETRKDMDNHSEYLRKLMANKYKELDS